MDDLGCAASGQSLIILEIAGLSSAGEVEGLGSIPNEIDVHSSDGRWCE